MACTVATFAYYISMSILYSHRYYSLTKTSNISIQADIIEVIFSSFHFTRVTLAVIFHSEHFSLPELGAVIEVKLGVEAHNLKNETKHFPFTFSYYPPNRVSDGQRPEGDFLCIFWQCFCSNFRENRFF